MSKVLRGILINPSDRTIMDVEFKDGLKEIYRLVACSTIEAVQVSERDTMYIDEEGLYAHPPKPFFSFAGREGAPICGNGLITGFDIRTGDNTSTRLTVDQVARVVVWREIELDDIRTTSKDTDDGFEIRVTSRFKPKEAE